MRDIKNLNIWKQEPVSKVSSEAFMDADITELNLGVRSYNCLKRAGCNTIRDIFNCMGEDGQGLRKIRNLGTRSENEIIEKIKEIKEIYAESNKYVIYMRQIQRMNQDGMRSESYLKKYQVPDRSKRSNREV